MNAGDLLNRHRGKIMGYAAVMVIVYHCFFDADSSVGNFFVGKNNKMGVDLFAFLSGFGLALALSKSPAFMPYFGKRMRRILPSYYVVLACMMPFMSLPLKSLWIAIIPVSVWVGNETLWYVSASIGYYLLIPMLFHVFMRTCIPRTALCILTALFALAVPEMLSFLNAEIALMRIPALTVGVCIGVLYARHRDAHEENKDLILLVILAGIGLALGFTGYNFGLLSRREVSFLSKNLCAPAFAMLLALGFELMDHTPLKPLGKAFGELGKYSLEIYFGHLIIKVISEKIVALPSTALLALLLLTAYPVARTIYFLGRLLLKPIDYFHGICNTQKTA